MVPRGGGFPVRRSSLPPFLGLLHLISFDNNSGVSCDHVAAPRPEPTDTTGSVSQALKRTFLRLMVQFHSRDLAEELRDEVVCPPLQ